MNDKQYSKSVLSSVLEATQNSVFKSTDHNNVGGGRPYLWMNPNDRILLSSHSKNYLSGSNPMPEIGAGKKTRFEFMVKMPDAPPPKGKHYAFYGSEKRTARSLIAVIDSKGEVKLKYPNQASANLERVTFFSTNVKTGVTDRHGMIGHDKNPMKFDGEIYEIVVMGRAGYTWEFEYLLYDGTGEYDVLPLPTPIWDVKIRNQNPYEDVLYLPLDDGWSNFPELEDDSGNMRDAITVKTQAADWATLTHDGKKGWKNWLTVGHDVDAGKDYYGFDYGWDYDSKELGKIYSSVTPEGHFITALYQVGHDPKKLYIESKEAWDAKVPLFTLNIEPLNKRLVFARDPNVPEGYALRDFGRTADLDKHVGQILGLALHTKYYAVPETDKPIYFWSTKSEYICMPNAPENEYKSSVKGFAKFNEAKVRFKLITPKTLPPENNKFAIIGVRGHGKSSMPLNMINDNGVLKWDFRNTQILSASEEKFDMYVDGVQKTHKSPVDELGKEVQIELVAKTDGGYFYYLGNDFGLGNYLTYPMPIFNIEMEEYGKVYLYADLKGGYTNHPISPDLTGNKRHLYFKNATINNYAPMLEDKTKDEANAGKA